MKAKEWMEQYRLIALRVDTLSMEIYSLRAKATSLSSVISSDKVSGGNTETSRMASIITKLVDKQDELQREIERLILEGEKIEYAIEAVQDDRQRELLRLRYLCGQTWASIASKMGVDVRWIYILHGRALSHISVPTD